MLWHYKDAWVFVSVACSFRALLGCDENSDALNVDLMMLRFVVRLLETDFQKSKEK